MGWRSLARSISIQPSVKHCGVQRIEIYQASDIVSKFRVRGRTHGELPGRIDALINPSNPFLAGTKFSYFPRGGPVPPRELSTSNSWGGMEAGPGMLYPAQVVDGRVTALGGRALAKQLAAIGGCPVGEAVLTDATEGLGNFFKYIIHTPPPFCETTSDQQQAGNPQRLLLGCYRASLEIANNHEEIKTVATPLLGAGCAGFSLPSAALALQEGMQEFLAAEKATSPLECVKIVVQSPWDVDTVLDVFDAFVEE